MAWSVKGFNSLQQREIFVDQLRGVALLGIAIANASAFAFSTGNIMSGATPTAMSSWITLGISTLITGKFYSLFAFLFGYSTKFTTNHYAEKGVRAFRRRLVFLALIGVTHGCLVFYGEIVLIYCIVSLVLIKFFYASNKTLVKGFFALHFLLAFLYLALAFFSSTGVSGEDAKIMATEAKRFTTIANAPFWSAAAARSEYYLTTSLISLPITGLPILGMFFLGLLAARENWFSPSSVLESRWMTPLIWLGPLGLLIAAWFSWVNFSGPVSVRGMTRLSLISEAANTLVTPVLTLSLIFLLQKGKKLLPAMFSVFALTGRCSLSCYVLQSLLFALVFFNWGFKQFDKLNNTQTLLVSLAVWAVCAGLIFLWTRFTRQGPLEGALSWWVGKAIN
jgi:uncharacterized protein